MEEYIDKTIKDMANKIRNKIVGGKLYGKVVTNDDVDALIVSAYLLRVQQETGERSIYKLMDM